MYRSCACCSASRGPTSCDVAFDPIEHTDLRASPPRGLSIWRTICARAIQRIELRWQPLPARRGPGSRRPVWRRWPPRGNRTMGPATRQAVAGPTLAVIGFGNTSQLKIAREQQTRDREDQRHWDHHLPLGCTPRNSIHEYSKHKIRGQPPNSVVDRRATKDCR